MVYPNQTTTSGLVTRQVQPSTTTINRPVTPTVQQPVTPTNYTSITKPKPPESTVKPVEINIPDFLKNAKR
jgi:cell division protein FtsZ